VVLIDAVITQMHTWIPQVFATWVVFHSCKPY